MEGSDRGVGAPLLPGRSRTSGRYLVTRHPPSGLNTTQTGGAVVGVVVSGVVAIDGFGVGAGTVTPFGIVGATVGGTVGGLVNGGIRPAVKGTAGSVVGTVKGIGAVAELAGTRVTVAAWLTVQVTPAANTAHDASVARITNHRPRRLIFRATM